MEWGFLKEVLEAMSFPRLMINWLMECVSTPYYSISLNGCLDGYFKRMKQTLRDMQPKSDHGIRSAGY